MPDTAVPKNYTMQGFRFLCEILSRLSVNSPEKNAFAEHARNSEPFIREECKQIQTIVCKWVADTGSVRSWEINELEAFLDSYYDDTSCSSFFTDAKTPKVLKSMFQSVFERQGRLQNDKLAGLAIAFVASAGVDRNPDFYLSPQNSRWLLTRSLEYLGYTNCDFIPDECFWFDGQDPNKNRDERKKGQLPKDTQQLMILSVYGALKYLFPHQNKDDQQNRNLRLAREKIEKLINDHPNSKILCALKESARINDICSSMTSAMLEDAEKVQFPNGKVVSLSDFYELPVFEGINGKLNQLLRSDIDYAIRSLVVGKTGSGKSMLTKAVICACLDGKNGATVKYQHYAHAMGLFGNSFMPLVLNCRELPHGEKISDLDLLRVAVMQLAHLTRKNPKYRSCLADWNEFEPRLMDYFYRRAKNNTLLLIIDDLSCLPTNACTDLLRNLKRMLNTVCPMLNVLAITGHLTASQMNILSDHIRLEIASPNQIPEVQISALLNNNIGSGTINYYLNLLQEDRCIRRFVDSPKQLVRLLCHAQDDPYLIHNLIRDQTDELLELNRCDDFFDSDFRDFLTALAVTVAENKRKNGLRPDYNRIPGNIRLSYSLAPLHDDPVKTEQLWQYIKDHHVLISTSSGINSYSFVSQMVYFGFVVDHYLSLLTSRTRVNWLERFNLLSAEDFSIIIVLLLERLCQNYNPDVITQEPISGYDLHLLIQAIAGYIIIQTDVNNLHHCLMALSDILSNKTIRDYFQTIIHKDLFPVLRMVYKECFELYQAQTDDKVKLRRIRPLAELNI